MSEKDFNFDQQVIDHLSVIIPREEEINNINPWSKPIGFITWGLILTTIHLSFLYLQYILPTIGVILIFLGFRSLRNENKYFKVLWVLSALKLFLQLVDLISVTTPLNILDYPEIAVGSIMLIFQISIFLIFQGALNKIYKNKDKPIKDKPLLWASLWTIVVFFIALSPLSRSWLVFIPMFICYILIVRSLYSIGTQLDDMGYALKNAPVKISNKTFGWAYFLIALVIVISSSAFYNHLELEPQVYNPSEISEERQHLLNMDFPADALQYLSDMDVALLSDAVNIEASNKMLMFDPKKIEHREGPEGHIYITHTYEPGKRNMNVSTIYIELPENLVYVMQYFTWKGGNPVWQDGIMISGETHAEDKEIVSSGLFYGKKGVDYIADFPRIICDEVTINSMFGVYDHVLITGALSYPFGAENQGGYVLYRNTVMTDSNVFSTHADFRYVHRLSPLHIPYTKTEDLILNYTFTLLMFSSPHMSRRICYPPESSVRGCTPK